MSFIDTHTVPELAVILAAVLLAGLMRGFAGFGSGLIWIPLASIIIGPKMAVPVLLVLDTLVALPLLFGAARMCQWKVVTPAALGAVPAVSIGAWLLAETPPVLVQWTISIVVVCLLSILLLNKHYSRPPGVPLSLGIGAASGLLGGFSQMPSIPMYTLWAAGPLPQAIIRANMIVFIAIADASAYASYAYHGLFTQDLLPILLITAPTYLACLAIGGRLFNKASPTFFRRVANCIIFAAAIISLPLFHG